MKFVLFCQWELTISFDIFISYLMNIIRICFFVPLKSKKNGFLWVCWCEPFIILLKCAFKLQAALILHEKRTSKIALFIFPNKIYGDYKCLCSFCYEFLGIALVRTKDATQTEVHRWEYFVVF